jgi:hypothetical protein
LLLRLRETEGSDKALRTRDEDDDRSFVEIITAAFEGESFRFDVSIDDTTSPDHLFGVDIRCQRGFPG